LSQLRRSDALSVDERAVRAAEVFDMQRIVGGCQLAVKARHECGVDYEFRAGGSSNRFDGSRRKSKRQVIP
jgi:hypothetical protein